MFNAKLYQQIISDWYKGINLQEGLSQIYYDNRIINDEAIRLIYLEDQPTDDDINNMRIILEISNVLYNNTSNNILPLEDGIYDLLIMKYKFFTGKNIIGARPVHFENQNQNEKEEVQLVPGVIYLDEEEKSYINDMLYHDDIYKTKVFSREDLLVPGVNYEKIISKRLNDTSHNNPELVGTLDKAKFVLMKQAIDKGVENDPTVNVLERDFFGKHVQMGIINPNQNIDVIAELKYDGVSIEADVVNKRIVSARTRGDTANDVASDLTPILEGYYFPDAPETNELIPSKFEAIMTHPNLELYSKLKGETFANCRTAIISLIGSSDAYQYRELITLVPLATGLKDENGNHIDRLVEVVFFNRYLCRNELLRYSVFSGDLTNVLFQIYRFAQEAEFMRRVLPFMYDGIVVSYLNSSLRRLLGRKDSVNQYSMAVKFNALKRETRFTGYEFTIGQNGEITPMIYYNPVEFFGTIHPKSSGHSYGNFMKQKLRLNDIVEVEYRNDVITYATRKDCIENDNNPNPVIEFPKVCPCCNTELVFTDKSAYCPNFICPERTIKRMANMMDKLQISGFAEETMKALNVNSFHELMELKLEDVLHLGELTSRDLIYKLDKLRKSNVYDYKLVGALGFTDAAANTWKLILNTISLGQFYLMMNKYLYDERDKSIINTMMNIKGIGEATVKTIVREYPYFIEDITYILENVNHTSVMLNKPIKVRFTGVRNQILVNILNEMGYDAGEGGVTKDTDILIVPYEGYNSGSKYKKAKEYGIKIIPIKEFVNDLGIDINL